MRDDDKRFYGNDERVMKLFELNDKLKTFKDYYELHIKKVLEKLGVPFSDLEQKDSQLLSYLKDDLDEILNMVVEE